jgi:phosphomannomutase
MIKFGTSGFRGIIGDNWTKENIQKIGAAFQRVALAGKTNINFTIGFDNRFMGRESAQWFCEAACNDKTHATFINVPVPSPLIANAAVSTDFGVVITASHNPYEYNGIKIFLNGGREADDEFCALLMTEINALATVKTTTFKDLEIKFSTDTSNYINQIIALLDIPKIKSAQPKVLFNPMHGSAIEVFRDLAKQIGIEYHAINDTSDPYFGGKLPCPYPPNLLDMAQDVVAGKYHFGVALDGDGDRVAIIDGDGKIYDCNYISAVILFYLTQTKKQRGGAVKNFLTSNLITKVCAKYGFEINETPVGFKFMGKVWQNSDAIVAAESGGMGIRNLSLAKDGVVTAAVIIDIIASTKKSIGELVAEVSALVNFPSMFMEYAYPFTATEREGVLSKLHATDKPKFFTDTIRVETYFDGFKIIFPNDYWCAARLSGNENVLRLYTEMRDQADCAKIIAELEKFYNMKQRQL